MTVLEVYIVKAREILPRCESYEQEFYSLPMLIEVPYFYKGKFTETRHEAVNLMFQKSNIGIAGGRDIITFWKYVPEKRPDYLDKFLNQEIG